MKNSVATKVLLFSFCLCEITGNIVLLLILSSAYESVTFSIYHTNQKWFSFHAEKLIESSGEVVPYCKFHNLCKNVYLF